MTEQTLREMIREMLKNELEEVSTSGAAGAFMTPNAFAGNPEDHMVRKGLGDKKKTKERSEQWGYKLVDEETIAENRYLQFKTEEGTVPQKIGRAIAEINRSLTELNRVVEMSARLKTETNIESSGLWKRTSKHLSVMEAKLSRLAGKIRELKS